MATIQITNNAIQYFAEMAGLDKEEAEEFLQTAIGMCIIKDSPAKPHGEVGSCPDCGAKLNFCTECQRHFQDELIT